MKPLGTYQIRFPEMGIRYPEPQFRADAQVLRDELRSKFLAGMAEIYDRYAEVARQKYNTLDPATERPPLALPETAAVVIPFKAAKKKTAKPAARKRK